MAWSAGFGRLRKGNGRWVYGVAKGGTPWKEGAGAMNERDESWGHKRQVADFMKETSYSCRGERI